MAMAATLNLTPWASAALSLEDQRRLGRRAVDLHVHVQAIGGKHGEWTVRVHSWEKDAQHSPVHRHEAHHLVGNLAQHIDACLSTYEAARERERYSADELVTIAAQSGMEIRRA